MRIFKQASIRRRLTLGLAAAITLVVLLFSVVSILYNNRSLEKKLNDRLDKMSSFSEENLSIALWQYNHDYIREYIESLFLYEDIVFASVIVNGKVIGQKIHPDYKEFEFSGFQKSRKFISAEKKVTFKKVNVGTFRLVFSRDRIRRIVITTSSLSILILLLVNLAVFGTNFFMSNLFMFKPLSKLEKSVKIISAGNLDAKIDATSEDEIGQLAKSFEQMMINLKKITASRDELNHEITERKRTERRVERLNILKESLLGSDPLAEKLKWITDSVVDILNADFARIWLIRKGDICDSVCAHTRTSDVSNPCYDTDKCLHLMASSGRYTHLDGPHGRIPIGYYKIGQIASGKMSGFLTNHAQHDPLVQDHEWAEKLNLVSFSGYNLLSGKGESIGVLGLFSKQVLTSKDETLLQTIGATASVVIQASKSQDMLQESEKKYRNLFENAQIGMFRSRIRDGKIIESNYKMAEILGYDSPEECMAKHIVNDSYLYPEQRKKIADLLKKHEDISNFEAQIRINDGSIKWIQFSGSFSENKDYFEGVMADITERKIAEEKLQASLKEKEVLFKEIHHRVKNNMQIIQSLLSLQSNEIKENKYKKPLIDSNNRIKSMALIHETLYQSDDIAKLNIETYFNEIIQHLFKIYHKQGLDITLTIDVDSLELGMDISIACGLIINELVSNALKYAFVITKKGNLLVSLKRKSDNKALLIIKDDGQGLPMGLDFKTIESLGLKIVKILVKGQLKGNLDVNSDNGTLFEIHFPLPT